MRRSAEFRHGCDDYAETPVPGRFNRRSSLRAAVFGPTADPWASRERTVFSGEVADVGPRALVLRTPAGERRLALTPETRTWRGAAVPPDALRRGDQVIVRTASRPRPTGRPRAAERSHEAGQPQETGRTQAAGRFREASQTQTAERIWARIGRVTGTIVESRDLELIVDEGPARGRQLVLIEPGSARQVQVRFPRIAPGYLIDVIGLRRPGYLLALTPATAQPPYRGDHPPAPPLVSGRVPDQISGTAVWHEPGGEPPGLRGIAYPALDPETSCDAPGTGPHSASRHSASQHSAAPHGVGPGCVRLPYLSVGSAVRIRNECGALDTVLPVTSCGAMSRLFCDRCVECGTSPRGRVADLTMTAFAELGGNLEDGCFNAMLTVPG